MPRVTNAFCRTGRGGLALTPNNGYAARRIHNLRAWAICEAERAHGIACCPARLCLAKLPRAGLVPSARSTKHPKLVYGVRGVHIRRNSVGWKLQPLKERFGGDGKVALHRWQQRRKEECELVAAR